MPTPTLVVSNPPHGEVDLDTAAKLLDLDVYAARLKAVFAAPEVLEARSDDAAFEFAVSLLATGLRVAVVPGSSLAEVPWPEPVQTLVLDVSSFQVTTRTESHRIPYDTEVLGVNCRPPDLQPLRSTVDLRQAIASEHGPTIAEAIQHRHVLDLYFLEGEATRRVTLVPELLSRDGERALSDLLKRLKGARLDERLVGVRPRAPFALGTPRTDGPERRRFSFGTRMLYDALSAIAPELRAIPQYELGSRLAFALSPLGALVRAR